MRRLRTVTLTLPKLHEDAPQNTTVRRVYSPQAYGYFRTLKILTSCIIPFSSQVRKIFNISLHNLILSIGKEMSITKQF